MKNKKIGLFLCILLVCLGILIFGDKSILPLDINKVFYIEFRIYPQDSPNFTVTDDERVAEIVSAINELDFEKCNSRTERMGEYYYYLSLSCDGNENIGIEFDENIISINDENYIANTEDLHELLERTYHDIQNWNIE